MPAYPTKNCLRPFLPLWRWDIIFLCSAQVALLQGWRGFQLGESRLHHLEREHA